MSGSKKNAVSTLSLHERRALVDREDCDLPLSWQAWLLGLNRTGLYYVPKPLSEEELLLRRRIDEINTDQPCYGSRRIGAILAREGLRASRKRVQRLMRDMGILAIYPGPKLSAGDESPKFPYLLRGVDINHPNHTWGSDITYIRLKGGFMYLTVFLDWYSRYVISWSFSDSLSADFVVEALEDAFRSARPMIINSDQGSQYTSNQYVDRIRSEDSNIRISMDGRGRCMDNIFTERFWRSYKQEEVYLKDYESPREARRSTAEYIDHYNHRRPHQALGYLTPWEVYTGRGSKGVNIK